jgi:hypothetical protein
MALKTDPLMAEFAVVAGARIIENTAALAPLPDKLDTRYKAWLAANEKLLQTRRDPRGDVRALDGVLDRAVGVPANVVRAILEGYSDAFLPLTEEQRQRVDDGLAIQTIFGSNLRDITALPYPQEWAAVRDVLHALQQGELAPAIQRLGLHADIARIASLHELYGAQLGITGPASATDESRALADWNQTLHTLLVAVSFFGDDRPELKAAFEEPYEKQLAAQRKSAAEDRKRAARHKPAPPAPEDDPKPRGK